MPNFYEKNGYDVEITVGSYYITTSLGQGENGLCDQLVIGASESNSRTAVFSFIPPETTVSLEQFQGALVNILIRKNVGGTGWIQAFKGWVDTPKLDFLARKITLECSDQRSNKVIQLPLGVVNGIGTYSSHVFGTSKDRSEELEKRLQTVAGSFDFDAYGNYQLTPWLPAVTPHFTMSSQYIYYGENPTVEYTNRVKTINTINIQVNYTYQRLHQQAATFAFAGLSDFVQDWFSAGKPSFPGKDTIKSAVYAGDWKVVTNGINFVDLWPASVYPAPGGGVITWQPNQVTEETRGRTVFSGYLRTFDSGSGTYQNVVAGNPPKLVPQYEPVLDSNGNQIMDVIKRTITDTSSHLCRGASWTSAIRFTQTVTEKYNITMIASKSVQKYGVIDSYENISVDDPYDVSVWEDTDAISFSTSNFYINQANNRLQLMQALQVSLNKARHDILNVHRDVMVSWRTVVPWPEIDLKHTVAIDCNQSAIGSTAQIQAKGKISTLQHVIDFETLEAFSRFTIRLSRSNGTISNSTWAVPVPLEDPSYIGPTRHINLAFRAGQDPEGFGADKWTGWIGNKEVINGLPTRTTYAERFIVDFPAIPAIVRDDIVYNSDATFLLNIPIDDLFTSF